jgi:hypothetical protein
MAVVNNKTAAVRTGWASWLAKVSFFVLLFEAVSGLAITFAPFSAVIQWGVLTHTLIGVITLLPIAWYCWIHWDDYRRYAMSHVVLLGYIALVALAVCAVSGVVVTWQGLLAIKMSNVWRQTHLISTFVVLGATLPHLVIPLARAIRSASSRSAWGYVWQSALVAVVGLALTWMLAGVYSGTEYVNEFPEDYSFVYGEDRPFAPSLATTASGGAMDSRILAGSETCGTSGCHEQILAEWKPSSHRYSAMDLAFQKVQSVMAEQNGPESTRYCGGCHDPISLFSGTKNIFVEDLTNLVGYQEGISCLSCHAIRETDIQGNANYTMSQPAEYLWQWEEDGPRKLASDFLIRTYPDEHNELSKRAYKAPEYCAACHKQFIDEEVNKVGWVQLQNQYDNWRKSKWNPEGEPDKVVECRECHMPLQASNDPASGDDMDSYRTKDDGQHRDHRFIASNSFVPKVLELEGWQEHHELTVAWLQGKREIPEIAYKWASGPAVDIEIQSPDSIRPGEEIDIRVVISSNKVGHDFPTGPLDIIQSWINLEVTDDQGNVVMSSGSRDEDHFIAPGAFMFKAEPVDRYGNLIDRHNLWEMVGVRYRRAIFPGFSDVARYTVVCPSSAGVPAEEARSSETPHKDFKVNTPGESRSLHVKASLDYRKADQFLLNFMFGEDSGLTSPVIRMSVDEKTIRIEEAS